MCAVVLALLSIPADAQSGPGVPTTRTIRGTVRDATTNEPAAGAQIAPFGSNTVVFTEADGMFVIEGAAAGPVQLHVSALGHDSRTVDVPADQDTIDAALAPPYGEQIVMVQRPQVPACVVQPPLPREMHRWELLSGFRVGSGLETRERGGGVFDLGLRAEATYAARSWLSPFRIGPFVALASTNVGSLEPMAGLTSYWGKTRILDNGRYQGSGAWVLSMSGGYAFQRDSMPQDAPVASVETGYAFLLHRQLATTGVCRSRWVVRTSPDDDVCDVGPRFPTSVRLYGNARVYTVDDPAWAVTLGVELEPFGSWSALASGFGM